MGIDAKETIVILWKILGYSMNTSIKCMRNHPILSGVSMFLLVLYIFLPSLLLFLIYSSPVLACAFVYAREKLGLRFSTSYKPFSSSEPTSCNGEQICHLRQQRSVRRNARMKVEEWDSQTSEEEKDKVILTSLYNDLLGRTPQFEESPKAIEANLVEENNEKAIGEEDSRDLSHLNVEEPKVCNCEIKYGELDGTEEMKEEMSNVNEHGISEIERNRRLESLIARRRARRLFRLALDQRNKLQAEETASPKQNNNNLQITVSRNSFERRRNYSSDASVRGLQIPGSAPSVLLQGRNPFDIPYDPQEERPNLTGDSFDQEFSLFNQKDIFFCRHESFCRFALFSPEHAQCMNSPVSASDFSSTRKRLDLDNEYMDHTQYKIPCNDKEATVKDDDKSVESGEREVEVNDGTDSDKEETEEVEINDGTDSDKEESDDSSCSGESESELSRLNNVELREAISQSMDNYPNFLVNQTRNNIPSTLPRGLVAPRLDDNNVFYTRRCANSHTRTFSVASDMQVEVSEIGSPPTTVDWLDDWSNGGESYMYDTDIDREIVRDEESRKRISSENESRSGTGSKDENIEPGTKLVVKPDQKCVADEKLQTVDDMSLLDRRSQIEEIFEQKQSSSSDVPTSFGKNEGLLFHTSVSLSSITEEPETILDSVDGRNSENMKYLSEEFTDQGSLSTLDSSMKKLIDEEVLDVQQVENGDICGSPKIIDLEQKDQILNSIQGEHDTDIDMKKCENTKPSEYEATKSFLDNSLDTPCVESIEREVEKEERSFTEGIIKQTESEAHQSDLRSSQGHVLTELLESEVLEENGQESVKSTDEKARPVEEERTHNILEASPSNPHTQFVEDYGKKDDASDVILLPVQDDNDSLLDESTDQEIPKEGEKSELLKDFYDESTKEYKNQAIVVEESVVSADTQNSQGSQPLTQQCGKDSSEGISPRTLEITQQLEQEDVIAPNTVSQDVDKDEFAVVANYLAASENNDEDNQKLYEKLTDQISLSTLDSSMKKLIDGEVHDVQQVENGDICGSPRIIDLEQKDHIMNSIQGEDDTEMDMKKYENTKPKEYEATTKSFLDDSLDTPCVKSFEREVEKEEESNLESFTEEITKQIDSEAHQSDLRSSPGHVLTELLESELLEENGQESVKSTGEKAMPIEEEKAHNIFEASPSHPHTQFVGHYGKEENASDVLVQDDNNSPLGESTDQEISKEGEKSESLKDSYDESTQEYTNRATVVEESVVSADTQNSQGSQAWTQQCGTDSSEGISPRTLEITQQLEQEDVIAPNTVSQDIDKDEFAAVTNDLAASENKDEDNQKLNEQVGEAIEKELELNLESLHHNIGLVAREDDGESKEVTGEMQNAEIQTTEDETES